MNRNLSVGALLAFLVVCVDASRAQAQVPLRNLRHAKFKHSASSDKGNAAVIKFSDDLALFFAGNPTCAGGDEVEVLISTSVGSTDRLVLPCSGWSGGDWSFRYSDKTGAVGGIKKITYGFGKLTLQMKGPNYRAIYGPTSFVEIEVRFGSRVLCGRTKEFKRNDAFGVVALGPLVACDAFTPTVTPTATETATWTSSPTASNTPIPTSTPTTTQTPTRTASPTRTATPTHTAVHTQTSTHTFTRTPTRTPTATPTSTAVPVCGNGIREGGEGCDDANTNNTDCCLSNCQVAATGSACLSDGNLCTDDTCNSTGACQHTNNTAACSDGSACTQSDQCSNGSCGGTAIKPWINEVNYDGYDVIYQVRDNEEFVEIAGPAGLDLSGYQISAVEGEGDGGFFTPCLSGGLDAGEAYFTKTIPLGTVIQDDTGKGTGFIVVCFDGTSGDIEDADKCDVILGGMPSSDSNLKEGALSNLYDCADGVLLRDPSNNLVDAVSYEGHVDNRGPLGSYFVGAPDIGRDWGVATDLRRSLVKTTDNLQRETDGSKWADSGNLNDSPGAVNGIQNLSCYQAPGYTATQYPIVLLHGLYGFDSLFGVVDYWNGITEALTDGNASVFVATVSQLNSPQARGEQAIPQIEQFLAQTGKSKVNLIGHSQGALDARYIAATRPDLVASVTSIAGPNKGVPVADLLAASFHDGTFGQDVVGLLGNALGDLLAMLSGSSDPNDAILAINSLTTASLSTFNAAYPAGVPTTACGEGDALVNDIYYFSWTGTGVQTNPFDPSDEFLGYASAIFLLEANDGLVGRCSSHLGDVIRDDYYQNHIDEVNLLFGLVSPLEVNPKTLFRQHANRLKNLGL